MPGIVHVAVGVITFKRAAGIRKLLQHVAAQRPSADHPFRITMIVVDNDGKGSAKPITDELATSPAFTMKYVSEPRLGIPIARNAALDAIPADADFFCFLDDDEFPSDVWLEELLRAQHQTQADCVHALVVPVFEDPSKTWIIESRAFDGPQREDLVEIGEAASNNVLIRVPFLRQSGLRFDERMLVTGGSDYLFFRQGVERGMKTHWSKKAIVFEDIPASRTTGRWLMQRNFRYGNTFAVAERILGGQGLLAKRVAIGGARVGLGVAMLPALPVSPYWGMRSLVHIVRGAGMVAGVLGHQYEEYAPKLLHRDRGING